MESVTQYIISFFTNRRNPSRIIQCLSLPNTSTSASFSYKNISRAILRETIYFLINGMSHPQTLKGPTKIAIDHESGPPSNVKVTIGEKYTFTCRYEGYPKPSTDLITWTFDDTIVAHDDKRFNIVHERSVTSLTIPRVSEKHIGRYGCQVGNYLGDYDKIEGSIVNVLPSPPTVSPKGLQYIITFGSFSLVVLLGGFVYLLRRRQFYMAGKVANFWTIMKL